MQRIVNLLVVKDNHVLLLKKPRRGWYVAPGGKMDPGESIYETAVREFTEETGANRLIRMLKGVYTMMIMDETGENVKNEWMLHTFIAFDLEGKPFETTVEGVLEWHPVESLADTSNGGRGSDKFTVCSFSGVGYSMERSFTRKNLNY